MLRGLRYSWGVQMEIRPVELGILRDEVLGYTRRAGREHFVAYLSKSRHNEGIAGARFRNLADRLAADEAQRLQDAELFFVAKPMILLANQAAATLPDFVVAPEDVPTINGFAYLDEPIADFVNEGGHRVRVVAVSWGPATTFSDSWSHGAVQVSWYYDTAVAHEGRDLSGVGSRLVLLSSSAFPFNESRQSQDENGDPFTAELALKALWLLMMQPVVSMNDAHYDRASARRYARQRMEPPRVRVITLRRMAGTGDGGSDRDYHHQWIVRGHWRQQWYPARQVHRPVWIAPHIKGPEGAPLLGGEKVYALRR